MLALPVEVAVLVVDDRGTVSELNADDSALCATRCECRDTLIIMVVKVEEVQPHNVGIE